MKWSVGSALRGALVLVALGAWGCDDEDAGQACAIDTECARGEICESGACTILACDRIGDCPGTGRTCLYDLRQCGAKECDGAINGEALSCPADRGECLTSGNFRSSCILPGTLSCQRDEDCAPVGAGQACCEGACSANCTPAPDMGPLPAGDMGPIMTDMGGVEDMGAQTVDMAMPGEARLCSACGNDGDCAALGDGARCTPIGGAGAFCTSACDPAGDDCPVGYQCVQGFDQCLPTTFECRGCLVSDCPAGETCDVFSAECVAPQAVCGTCTDDAGCQAGLSCADFGGARFCLQPSAGGCAAGYMAQGDVCVPEGGQCDPCGGVCAGDTPFCDVNTAQCRQCGPGSPCAAPLTCDLDTLNCTDSGPGCVSDIDCNAGDRGVCFNGECIQCFDDSQCPPRQACNENFSCIPSPCAGVACQRPAMCNPNTGACDPGCQTNQDCVLPDEMECNGQTGQCFFRDGSCSLAGLEGVCAPGGQCLPGLATLGNPDRGNCSCLKQDPADALSPDLIPCQPGLICLQGGLPGFPPPETGTCFGF